MWKKGFCYAQQSPKKAMFWAESSVYFTAKREDLSIAEKIEKGLAFPLSSWYDATCGFLD